MVPLSFPFALSSSRRIALGVVAWIVFLGTAIADDYAASLVGTVETRAADNDEYLGAPSLVRNGDGSLLAFYGEHGTNYGNLERSTDDGESWRRVAGTAFDQGTLWAVGDTTYLIGTFRGDIDIRRSNDGGQSWSGSRTLRDTSAEFLQGETPALIHNGRVYVCFYDRSGDGGWPRNLRPFMGSCPTGQVMNAASWTWTNTVTFPSSGSLPITGVYGFFEGNPFVADGKVMALFRVNGRASHQYGAMFSLSGDRRTLRFNNRFKPVLAAGESGFTYVPGGESKFHVVRDPDSGKLLMASNPAGGDRPDRVPGIPDARFPSCRNVLAVFHCDHGSDWQWMKAAVKDQRHVNWQTSVQRSGFQQPSMIIDGNDLLILSRTAEGTSPNYHDAKKITLHRVRNFRGRLGRNDEIARYTFDAAAKMTQDRSGQGNRNTVRGVTYTSAGRNGGGGRFGGDGDRLDGGWRWGSEMHGRAGFTFVADVKPAAGGGERVLFQTPIDGSRWGVCVRLMSGGKLRVNASSHPDETARSRVFNFNHPNQWRRVAVVVEFNNDRVRLYVDGVERPGTGTTNFSRTTYRRGRPTVAETIGATHDGKKGFAGTIDNVRLFRRALSASQIRDL